MRPESSSPSTPSDPEREPPSLYATASQDQREIEAALEAEALEWTGARGTGNLRYLLPVADFGVSYESRWPELQDKLIEAMQAFIKALQPHIDALKE